MSEETRSAAPAEEATSNDQPLGPPREEAAQKTEPMKAAQQPLGPEGR